MILFSRILKTLFIFSLFFPAHAFANNEIFAMELLERQKALYQASQNEESHWDAFFGGAVYLRSIGNTQAVDHSLALEMMALGRHCQWRTLLELANIFDDKKQYPLATKAMTLIRLKKGFQKFSTDPTNLNDTFLGSLQKIRDQWPLKKKELLLLTHPENIRLHVGSRCE